MNSIPAGTFTYIDSESREWQVTPVSPRDVDGNSPPVKSPELDHERVIISAEARRRYASEDIAPVAQRQRDDTATLQNQGTLGSSKDQAAAIRQLANATGQPSSALMLKLREHAAANEPVQFELKAAQVQMQEAYIAVVRDFMKTNPDFDLASSGFSVNANGTLGIKNSGTMAPDQALRFQTALNKSPELAGIASKVADLHIRSHELEHFGDPYFKLDRDNYAQTIDLGLAALSGYAASQIPKQEWEHPLSTYAGDHTLRDQLMRNGEPRVR